MWHSEQNCCSSFENFLEERHKEFDSSIQGTEASQALSLLRQGKQSVSSYSIEFCTFAESCGWNDKALWDYFLHGLADHIKDEIYSLELPSSLDGLINFAVCVDNWISLRYRHRRSVFPPAGWEITVDCKRVTLSPGQPTMSLQLGSRSRGSFVAGSKAALTAQRSMYCDRH